MKRIFTNSLLALTAVICFAACGKKDDATTTETTVEITVADGRTGYAASDATVNLYESMTAVNSNTPKYTQVTDQANKVKITVAYLSKYYVVVTKSTAKNYYSGLLPVAVFQTQAQIQGSAIQSPPGTIGGVKYQDTNGDGIINNADKVNAPTITLTEHANTTQTVTVY